MQYAITSSTLGFWSCIYGVLYFCYTGKSDFTATIIIELHSKRQSFWTENTVSYTVSRLLFWHKMICGREMFSFSPLSFQPKWCQCSAGNCWYLGANVISRFVHCMFRWKWFWYLRLAICNSCSIEYSLLHSAFDLFTIIMLGCSAVRSDGRSSILICNVLIHFKLLIQLLLLYHICWTVMTSCPFPWNCRRVSKSHAKSIISFYTRIKRCALHYQVNDPA